MTDSMNSNVMDWDDAYREEGGFEGPPPWNIGEPQPELAALIRAGKVRSDVLDAGCGHAELSLALAADGLHRRRHRVDPDRRRRGEKAAQERNLPNATFVQDDITTFTGYDGRFNTIIDSTLFHSLPIEGRDRYQQSVYRAAAPGAVYYILVFAKGAFPAELEHQAQRGRRGRVAGGGRQVLGDRRGPPGVHPCQSGGRLPFELPPHPHDDKGRVKLPAFLLTAHKA